MTQTVDAEFNTYIAKPTTTGHSSATGVVGYSSVYLPLRKGISHVTVSWGGATEIWVQHGPNGNTTSGGYRLADLPAGDTARSVSTIVQSSKTYHTIWLSVRNCSTEDLDKEIGIQVSRYVAE